MSHCPAWQIIVSNKLNVSLLARAYLCLECLISFLKTQVSPSAGPAGSSYSQFRHRYFNILFALSTYKLKTLTVSESNLHWNPILSLSLSLSLCVCVYASACVQESSVKESSVKELIPRRTTGVRRSFERGQNRSLTGLLEALVFVSDEDPPSISGSLLTVLTMLPRSELLLLPASPPPCLPPSLPASLPPLCVPRPSLALPPHPVAAAKDDMVSSWN